MAGTDPRTTLALSLQGRMPVSSTPTLRTIRPLARPMAMPVLRTTQFTKSKHQPRSLLQQVSDQIGGLIPGIGHLATQAGVQLMAPIRAARDVVEGNISPLHGLKVMALGFVPGLPQGSEADNRKYTPLSADMADSMIRTAGNLRHPTRYVRAVNDGTIVDTVLQDAGNLSIVLGPVAKGLGAGAGMAETAGYARTASAMERASVVAERVAKLGGETANLPVSVYRKGLRLAGEGLSEGFARALQAEGRLAPIGEAARGLQERFPMQLTEEGRIARANALQGRSRAARAAATVNREMRDAAAATGDNVTEQGAAAALINGVGGIDQLVQQAADAKGLNLAAEDVRRLHVLENRPEQTMTPDVQQAVRDFLAGTDPAAVERINTNQTAARRLLGKVQDLAMSGEAGRPALSPAQLGDAPIDQYVIGELEKAGYAQGDLQAITQLRGQGMEWSDIAQAVPELDGILNDPIVYPSKWRPAMVHARNANAAVAEAGVSLGLDVPVRPADMIAAGMESPTYMPGGRSDLIDPKSVRLGREPVNIGMSGYQGIGADHMRVASEIQPYSFRALADKASSLVRTHEFNKALVEFVNNDKLLKVDTKLGPDIMAGIEESAARIAEAQVNRGITGIADVHGPEARIKLRESAAYKHAYGQAIIDALKEQGYEIFAGDAKNPQVGDFKPDTAIKPENVTPDAIVLPAGVKARLVQQMVGRNLNVPLRVLQAVNTKFKGAVLPFSVRWHLGDLVGGAFMGWVGGGIPPTELIARMRELKNLSGDAHEAIVNHPDFVDAGLSFEEARWRNDGPGAKQPRTPIGKLQRKSFAFNEAINKYNRQGYLLAKVERLLAKDGLSVDAVDNAGAWDHPDVQKAITDAVHDANKVMGTFDELTPFEQRWMKNIFPFYVWTRHITMLAARVAIDNPSRMVWTLRLGAYGADTQDLPDWLKGSITVPDALMPDQIAQGDTLLPTQFLNPFNDVLSNPGFTPQGMMRSLSPGIKIPMAGLFGVEPGTSFAQPVRAITRPYGETRNPLTDTIAAGLRTFPITKEAQNLLPTSWSFGGIGLGPHPRYTSGRNMVNADGTPIDTTSRAQTPLRLIGLPVPTPVSDAQAIQKAHAKASKIRGQKKKKVKLG